MGENLSRKLRPVRVNNRRLLLRASSSTWAQEASMMQRQILQNIRRAVGPGIVNEIRVQVGFSPGSVEDSSDIDADANETGDGQAEVQPGISLSCSEGQELDLVDRVERLRQADQEIKDWRRKQGWPKCGVCGERYPPDIKADCCPICLRERIRHHEWKVKRAVEEAPWLSVRALQKETGAPEKVCSRVRSEAAHFWQSRICEAVQYAGDGLSLPEDFGRRVLQAVSMRAGRRHPTLDWSSVKEACGRSAADLYFYKESGRS